MVVTGDARPPGRLIAVEGLDGSGKSTQIYLLRRWLELQGLKVFFTEWNSSQMVRRATRRGKKKQLLTPITFSLIHSTDFADRYERQILPLLKAGFIVLADRYIYTAMARDVARGCSPTWVQNLYSFALQPDITFFFHVPLDVAVHRILSSRTKLKYHEAGMDLGLSPDPVESFKLFQDRVQAQYLSMVEKFDFTVIDAARPIEEQQEEVRQVVEEKIDLARFRWRTRR
ncbi:MAG: dTMP kinase [Chloroflexi bacterium]|nr:dTMP kinase [Chloroflexota bacterium]